MIEIYINELFVNKDIGGYGMRFEVAHSMSDDAEERPNVHAFIQDSCTAALNNYKRDDEVFSNPQKLCMVGVNSSLRTLSSAHMDPNPYFPLSLYNKESIEDTLPTLYQKSEDLGKKGLFIPYMIFVDSEFFKEVMEAKEKENRDTYILCVFSFRSSNTKPSDKDLMISTINMNLLFEESKTVQDSFYDREEDILRSYTPILLSGVTGNSISIFGNDTATSTMYISQDETEEMRYPSKSIQDDVADLEGKNGKE